MYSLIYISRYISILKIRKDWFSSNCMDRKLNLSYGFLCSQWFRTALVSHIILWHWTHYVCIYMVCCKSKRATHDREKILRPRIKVMYPTVCNNLTCNRCTTFDDYKCTRHIISVFLFVSQCDTHVQHCVLLHM